MRLLDVFPESRLLVELKSRDKRGALREVIEHLVAAEVISDDIGRKLERAVTKREGEGSTGIGKGLAIPHAKECGFLEEVIAVMARSQEGIDFSSIDGEPVRLIFLVASPLNCADKHLQLMKKIATLNRDEKTLKFLMTTRKTATVLEILKEIDESCK
jgi:mannitol/fructose-specific phosphotransferase system IIA component (Ntr-type)